tara:strand:+ start:143 stop:517 length:375 start_codon:yes stop_codon:yes gene_type:complete
MRQSSLIILKPNVVAKHNVVEIIAEIQALGYEIEKYTPFRPDKTFLRQFYVEHAQKGWFGELLDYMTEGHSIVIKVSGYKAIDRWRHDIDAFREKYGEDFSRNGFHGSDSIESANRELGLLGWN